VKPRRIVLAIAVASSVLSSKQGVTSEGQRNQDALQLLSAVVEGIGLLDEDLFVAGPQLSAAHREALKKVIGRELSENAPPAGYLVAPNAVIVERITVAGSRATAEITSGPVPAAPKLTCGAALIFILRRQPVWTIDEEASAVKCANRAALKGSQHEQDLREVFRLAMGDVDGEVTFVVDSKLDAAAVAVLREAGSVVSPEEARTAEYTLPANHIRLRTLTVVDGVGTFEGTWGPIPVPSKIVGSCGYGVTFRVRRNAAGWTVLEQSSRVC
jgi:hypothetical protein